jgi:hypothetical protein
MVSVKEKRELALIFTAVFVVAIVGVFASFVSFNATGSAIEINLDNPTPAGFVHLLESGVVVDNPDSLSCDEVCGSLVCVPLQETCSVASSYPCKCYEVPQ